MKKYFYLTGASGVGKSTLLKSIRDFKLINVETLEVSARPYLPKTGSYVETLTDELQALIVQHRTLTSLEAFLEGGNYIFSRGPIDNLAYQRVLNKGQFLDSASKREIDIIKNSKLCHFFYIPIEFKMSDKTDLIRGDDERIQKLVDLEIQKILLEADISFTLLSGTVKERFDIAFEVFEKNNLILPF